MRFFVATTVLLLSLVSGCVDDAAGPESSATPTSSVPLGSETGTLQGTVTTEELAPIAKARITMVTSILVATTQEDGSFIIEKVPPGEHKLIVEALGYQSVAANVAVVADEVTDVRYQLIELAIIVPYTELVILAGFTECVASLIYFTQTFSSPLCTQQNVAIDVPVADTWRYGIVEQVWAGQTSMHMVSDDDSSCGFGNASANSCFFWKIGRSPQRLDAKPMDPAYVQWKMLYPEFFTWSLTGLDAGFLQQEINDAPTCALSYQTVVGYTAPCGGVGIGYPGYRFDLYASIFHHEAPGDPSSYSAVPK